MTDREKKLKIYGIIINSVERYATLEGIAHGMEMSAALSDDMQDFINGLFEILTFNNSVEQLQKYANIYFAKN